MIEKSRLRLSAGLVALTLALGACGGADKGALAPAPSTAAAPASGSAAPSTTAAPASPSASASTATPSASASTASPTAADASAPAQTDEPVAEEDPTEDGAPAEDAETEMDAPDVEGFAAEDADETAPPASEEAPAEESMSAEAESASETEPESADPDAVEASPSRAQDTPTSDVAPEDTPVAVSTPRPQLPAEQVAPEDVHPAPAPRPAATTPRAAKSSTAAAPGSTRPTPSSGSGAPAASPSAPPASDPAPAEPAEPVEQGAVDCSVTPCVALTFDDGPGRHTGRLLNILAAEQVPATFYVVGQSAELNPALIARMADEGHQVGNHSYSHPNLTTLSASQVLEEIQRTDAAIRAAGATPSTVRAPYGALNESVLADFADLPRAGSVTWSVDTRDWEHKDPAQTLANVKAQTSAGGIILMHDIHATTVDAVPDVIAWLKDQGYAFVTVDEITGGVGPGRTVRSGMHP